MARKKPIDPPAPPLPEWTVDRVLLALLARLSEVMTRQEGYRLTIRSCVVLTRTEAFHIGWEWDGRLSHCRAVTVPERSMSIWSWQPLRPHYSLALDLRQFSDLESICPPLECDYHCDGGPMRGRGGTMWLTPQGRLVERAVFCS